jgi:DNA-binding response OmpR family regulator
MLMPHPYHVVFVEPTLSQTGQMRQLLEFEGIAVSHVDSESLSRHQQLPLNPDLVVFNQTRLRRSTLALAGEIGRGGPPRPLIAALVAQGDEVSGIELVERGLDAFIVTPCGPREFVARVRALLRRARTPGNGSPAIQSAAHAVRVSDLDIDPARRRVRVKEHELRLTEQEFQLLYFLAGHPGRVFDRQALLDAVWGRDTFVTARSVDALVKRVRQHLRTAGRSESCVETVRGVGYRLNDRVFRASAPAA